MKTKVGILYFKYNWVIFYLLFNIYGFSMTNPMGGAGLSYGAGLGVSVFGEFDRPLSK